MRELAARARARGRPTDRRVPHPRALAVVQAGHRDQMDLAAQAVAQALPQTVAPVEPPGAAAPPGRTVHQARLRRAVEPAEQQSPMVLAGKVPAPIPARRAARAGHQVPRVPVGQRAPRVPLRPAVPEVPPDRAAPVRLVVPAVLRRRVWRLELAGPVDRGDPQPRATVRTDQAIRTDHCTPTYRLLAKVQPHAHHDPTRCYRGPALGE